MRLHSLDRYYDSIAPRLAALNARHRTLDVRIETESRRPLPDTLRIQEMKRSKLAVKEEIARIERLRRREAAGDAA